MAMYILFIYLPPIVLVSDCKDCIFQVIWQYCLIPLLTDRGRAAAGRGPHPVPNPHHREGHGPAGRQRGGGRGRALRLENLQLLDICLLPAVLWRGHRRREEQSPLLDGADAGQVVPPVPGAAQARPLWAVLGLRPPSVQHRHLRQRVRVFPEVIWLTGWD